MRVSVRFDITFRSPRGSATTISVVANAMRRKYRLAVIPEPLETMNSLNDDLLFRNSANDRPARFGQFVRPANPS